MKKYFIVLLVIITAMTNVFANGNTETADTGKTELIFWTRINDTFEQEIAEFEALHPDVTIKRVGIGNDYDDLTTKYIASAISGELPHVGMVSQRYGIPQLYDAGVIAPIDNFISDEEASDIMEAYWNKYTYKGYKVAVPFQVSMPMLYINTDLFNEYGVEIPKTLDEVVEAAKSLTKDTNGDGVTDIYGFNMPADLPWYLNGFFKAAGADIISSPTEVNINQPEVVEVLEAFKQMALDGSMPANQHSTAKDDFGNGTVAMILNSCSSNRTISNAVNGKFNYELVNFPSINGNICAPLGGNGLAVFKSDEKMEQLAWEFVKFMISTNAYCGYTMEKGYIPISKSTMQDEKVQERINDPFWKSTYDQIDDLYGQPINPVDATIWNNLVDIFSLVEENPQSSDIAKLVSDMQKEIDDFLEEY